MTKYNTKYIQFGFIMMSSDAELKAQCAKSGEILLVSYFWSPYVCCFHLYFRKLVFGIF